MAYVISDGEVVRTFFEGKGLSFKETFRKKDGSTGEAYFSAFFSEPHGLSEGDRGTFKGNLSVKGQEYEKQDGTRGYSADATLNNAKFEASSAGGEDSPF